MSDFGSLLQQFQKDSTKRKPSEEDNNNSNNASRKRQRRQQQRDAQDFPPVKEILVVCPHFVQTGGPEALHQLCDQLNRSQRVSAKMVYCRTNGFTVSCVLQPRTPLSYHRYNAPSVDHDPFQEEEEEGGNLSQLLIWPECWTNQMLDYMSSGPQPTSPCVIWWLSVDNNTGRFREWERNDIIHLYQSEYARQHLLKNKATHILPMTEYISDPPKPGDKDRTIDVVFNPVKGIHFTDEIRKRSEPLVQFRPIGGGADGRIRISPEEVRNLLQQAKVYIDFGPHPGMDRLPREAALAGCVIVTNTKGAALYQQDVPLPQRYKVAKFDTEAIHKLLMDILKNFEERSEEMGHYRKWINGQAAEMKNCVDNLLIELIDKRKS